MNTITKYLLAVMAGILILGLGALSIYQWRLSVANQKLLSMKAEELQQANLEVGKAHTQLLDQDALHKKAMAELDAKLQKEIKDHNALINMYATLEAAYNAENAQVNTLTNTVEELLKASSIADIPTDKLFYKKEDGTLNEVKSIKWTYQDFRIDLTGESTPNGFNEDKTIKIKHDINYKLHLLFKAKVVKTTTPNNVDNFYGELYEVDDKGKELNKLTLTSFEVIEAKTFPKRMWWWDPHLDLGVGLGMNFKKGITGTGELGFSFMGYGKTKDDIDWRFIRVAAGLSMTKGFVVSFSPVLWNFGKKLPLTSNLWLTPAFGYDVVERTEFVTLGVSVVF